MREERLLGRSESAIAVVVDVVLIDAIEQILISLVKIATACRLRVDQAGPLPIGDQLRVDEVVGNHPLDLVLVQVVETEDAIANEHSLELDGLWLLVEDAQSKIRNVLASVGLACKIEGVVDVLWEFAPEEIFESV